MRLKIFVHTIAIIDEGKLVTQGQPEELILQNKCNSIEEVYLKITGAAFRDK